MRARAGHHLSCHQIRRGVCARRLEQNRLAAKRSYNKRIAKQTSDAQRMAEVETEIVKLRSLVAEQQQQITVLSSAISLMRNHGPEQLRELFKQQSVGQVPAAQPQPSPTPQQPPPPQQPPALLTVPSGNASGDARGLTALSPTSQSPPSAVASPTAAAAPTAVASASPTEAPEPADPGTLMQRPTNDAMAVCQVASQMALQQPGYAPTGPQEPG